MNGGAASSAPSPTREPRDSDEPESASRSEPAPQRSWWRGPISGPVYFVVGAVLVAAKFGLDSVIANRFEVAWTPFDYFVWPSGATRGLQIESQRSFALTLLLVSVPFVVVGVWLTVRRLRALRWPIALAALFFVPIVNFVLFAVLTFSTSDRRMLGAGRLPDALRTPATGAVFWDTRAFVAILVSAIATDLFAWIGVTLVSIYGFGLFVGAPFLLGLSTTLIAGWNRTRPKWHYMALSFAAQFFAVGAGFLIGGEGVACIVMALPFAVPIALLGSAVGIAVLAQRQDAWSYRGFVLAMVALAPTLMAAEWSSSPQPELRAVVTSIVVDAPPDVVWRHVVAFPPLPPAREFWSRAGIATPLRATIDGTGVGAVRHCVFTTGEFVEPITIWDEPRQLRFDVTDQPAPMKEFSLYEIDPPHLHGFLVSKQGQFRLEPLEPDASSDSLDSNESRDPMSSPVAPRHVRTRLEGTTWYTNRMWPQSYWSLWSDALIHAIHRRVLEHVGRIAEAERGGVTAGAPR